MATATPVLIDVVIRPSDLDVAEVLGVSHAGHGGRNRRLFPALCQRRPLRGYDAVVTSRSARWPRRTASGVAVVHLAYVVVPVVVITGGAVQVASSFNGGNLTDVERRF